MSAEVERTMLVAVANDIKGSHLQFAEELRSINRYTYWDSWAGNFHLLDWHQMMVQDSEKSRGNLLPVKRPLHKVEHVGISVASNVAILLAFPASQPRAV